MDVCDSSDRSTSLSVGDLEGSLQDLDLRPPPLCVQGRMCRAELDEDSPVHYRSAYHFDDGAQSSSSYLEEEYEEEVVYRSIPVHAASWRHDSLRDSQGSYSEEEFFSAEHGFQRAKDRACCGYAVASSSCAAITLPPPTFRFELPEELLFSVMLFLAPKPDLFSASRVCRSWRTCARETQAARRVRVPAALNALVHAVDCAQAGDTLVLDPGVHELSVELSIDKPLRLLGATDAAGVIVSSSQHVVLRTRCPARLSGISLCRMGDEVGYPNAVVFAEVGKLSMEACRITCGGAASQPAEALQVFDEAPPAGQHWSSALPESPLAEDPSGSGGGARQDRPQSGVWVGAAARVELRRCHILCTVGPGVKIYRGELEAEENTIAFSYRGANIVANGGKVLLRRNEIRGAMGDGISSWNDAHLTVDNNHIHSNTGSGIAVNAANGKVSITGNIIESNQNSAVLFVAHQTQPVTLTKDNDLERNKCGGVQGLRQGAPGRPGRAGGHRQHAADDSQRSALPLVSRQRSV